MADKYEVFYSRATFSGSPNERGMLISTPENEWVWLKDVRGKTIEKGQIRGSKLKSIRSGKITQLGTYKVLLDRIVRETQREVKKATAPSEKHVMPNTTASDTGAASTDSLAESKTAERVVREFEKKPELDDKLLSVMHKHQALAAKFVLERLLGTEPAQLKSDHPASAPAPQDVAKEEEGRDAVAAAAAAGSSGGGGGGGCSLDHNPFSSSDLPITGCILADEMGLGKSLSALCVLWSFVRHGRGKGVIVCPSSLVGNWSQEISKWLKGLHSKTTFVKSAQKDRQVYDFIKGDSSTHPLLVISYENFRSVAEHLNKLRNWEAIVCDEGHRLKNADLTQTSLALGNCVAQRRLVLTGTPIQNNLDELYSVVNFVCPGYFGTLEDFTMNFTDPIELRGGAVRDAAMTKLKLLLRRILLRRERDDVLSDMLPPKRSYVVYCSLSATQRKRYVEQAERLFDGLKLNRSEKKSKDGKNAQKKKKMKRKEEEEEEEESTGGTNSGEGELVYGFEQGSAEGAQKESQAAGADHDGEEDGANGEEGGDGGGDGASGGARQARTKRKRGTTSTGNGTTSEAQVLPALMELRLTADTSNVVSKKEALLGSGSGLGLGSGSVLAEEPRSASHSLGLHAESEEGGAAGAAAKAVTKEDQETRRAKAEVVVSRSGKMALLDSLLTAIKAQPDTQDAQDNNTHNLAEKAVVVSNFQNVLDEVETLARGRGWHLLRIDGDVPAERRMKFVAHFNNPASPFFLMLLSSKAGGVGLNLVGGSRLVLIDPDWNPATDQQAMGRIWRDGQTKPVHIYRFISAGSIEETILGRQRVKGALSAVIDVQRSAGADGSDGGVKGSVGNGKSPSSSGSVNAKVGREDINKMIYPRSKGYIEQEQDGAHVDVSAFGEDCVLGALAKEPMCLDIKRVD